MAKGGEIYIYAQVQSVVPPKDIEATAEKNSTDQIVTFSPPRIRGEGHFEFMHRLSHGTAAQNGGDIVIHMPFYSTMEITRNTHNNATCQCGEKVKFIQGGWRLRLVPSADEIFWT